MWQALVSSWKSLPHLTWVSVADILLVAILIYQAIRILRGRRAANVLSGIGILILVYILSIVSRLDLMRTILETMAPYTAFALIVMFQSEIRRVLSSLSEGRLFTLGRQLESREVIDEIVLAVSHLSKECQGALIVLEGEVGLRTFVESGVPVDSQVTRDLLLAIFYPGGSLHDGAVIVQGGRLAAAACFLPLTMNPELSLQLGTRHRAAIGVTEESDCLAVVVSEETGRISVARRGELTSNLSVEELAGILGHPRGGARAAAASVKPGVTR